MNGGFITVHEWFYQYKLPFKTQWNTFLFGRHSDSFNIILAAHFRRKRVLREAQWIDRMGMGISHADGRPNWSL